MKFKIAVVQFEIKQFCPEENLRKANKFIRKASGKADVIIFPEDFITGPLTESPGIRIEDFVDFDGKYIKHFQKLAKKYNIDIVSGSWIEGTRKGWYNTSYYIDSSGRVLGKYCKNNLWLTERSYLVPGDDISVFNTRFGKIGLIICWDLIFPEIFRKMAKIGVNIVICPSYWCYGDAGPGIQYDANSEIKLVDSLCATRAFENEIIIVYCNAAGKFRLGKFKDKLIGHSQVSVPFKGAIKILNHNKEEMFIQEVNTDILKNAERAYKIRKDLKTRLL